MVKIYHASRSVEVSKKEQFQLTSGLLGKFKTKELSENDDLSLNDEENDEFSLDESQGEEEDID